MSYEGESVTAVEKYKRKLHDELERIRERLARVSYNETYFLKLEHIAREHGASYISFSYSFDSNGTTRPRMWLSFNVNSFRDMATIFTAFDNVAIDVNGWTEEIVDEEERKMWRWADEQVEIYLNAYLNDASTCEKIQVGEKEITVATYEKKTVPVYDYICKDEGDAA